jgi:protein phosphatase
LRSRNEDSFLCDDVHHVYAVADGLGGLKNGDLASRTAIEGLKKKLKKIPAGTVLDWRTIFEELNCQVFALDPSENVLEINVGTTLTAVQVLPDGLLHIGHAGDSGIFRFTRDTADQLTTDHTMAQEEIARHGIQVAASLPVEYRHTLTRCLGLPEAFDADVFDVTVVPGDRILLYTDGVTKVCAAHYLRDSIFDATDPRGFVDALIEHGNARGGPDNITAVALFF